VTEYVDKKDREIEIQCDGDTAVAYHEGRIVGSIETSGLDWIDERMAPLPPKITSWNVEGEYQGAGICLAMLRALVEISGPLRRAQSVDEPRNPSMLTEAGMAMTRCGQRHGLILPFRIAADDEHD
jgi:hypothetical protein